MNHMLQKRTNYKSTRLSSSLCTSSNVLMMVMIIGLLILTTTVSATDTSVLNPINISDGHGNSANGNSSIQYRNVPKTPARELECTYCDGGIRSFLDMAEVFAHTVAPEYPYDLIKHVSDGQTDEITNDYQKLIKDNLALVVCIAVGFLFMIFFPIVGCFVCCCRCCGNCGGSRRTDGRSRKGCARPCLMVSLFVTSTFVGVGGLMLFLMDAPLSDGINGARDDVPETLDSLKKFLNDTSNVITDIATTDLNFTRDVVFRDLDNIGFLLGGELQDNLIKETRVHLDAISSSVLTVDQVLNDLKQQLPKINKQLDHVKSNLTDYTDQMDAIKTDFETSTGEQAPDIQASVDENQLTPLEGTSQLNDVGNLTEKLQDAMKEIDNIPEKVHNESSQSVTDLKTSILDYTSSVTDKTDAFNFADKIKTNDIKEKINEYTEKPKDYDQYKSYLIQGLSGIVLLIACLLIIGLLLGAFSGSASTPPQERGCASNSGGNFLVASVVLTFLFGSLLMLITTLLFMVGSSVENFACVPFRDTSMLDKLIDDYHILGKVDGRGTFLAAKLLDDPNENLTITEIMDACKNNVAIYKALRINETGLFNISEILDYKSKFSVKDDLSSVKIDFSKIKILTPELKDSIKDFNDSIQYDLNSYTSQLRKNVTDGAATFKQDLEAKRSKVTDPNKVAAYDRAINDLDQAIKQEGKSLQDSMAVLDGQLTDLSNTLHPPSKPSLSDELGTMQNSMAGFDANIETAGTNSLNGALDSYTDRIFGIIDSFIDRILYSLDNNIGQCSPIWTAYNHIFIDSICDTLIGSINGVWFSLGWSLFFLMPSMVLALKLSSHFRTMTLHEDYKYGANGTPPASTRNNKVAPVDEIALQEKNWIH